MVRWRALGKRLFVWLVALLAVAATVLVAYAATGPDAAADRVDAVREAPDLTVVGREGGFVLQDRDPDGDRVALVFYPGGRVDAAAYLPTLAPLVERTDVRVYVPRVPLRLAVLDPGRAGRVATGDDVVATYVGGHSLGGAMACRHAGDHRDRVEGVLLLAAYCVDDVSDTDLDVLTVNGDRDAVVDRERIAASRDLLPEDARFVELAGFNHSSFAAYHGQRGDQSATVTFGQAKRRLTRLLVGWFENRSDVAPA
jgi:pimeloyl-ACP methyl ester carboxylesterase